ncbi:molybdenum cofactor cytidylyltransferase (plasmid) [Halostagnicola larsenii XH-48]|uniref:Molybdenum cofactor cytidylyltransferase n=1 Tax=Halostagnicola larsenii XH-48 TaxID=797299 RepID=W0JVE9_9EURY|nr:nucleotidyltransferase family protein [Halostagnicola larsenii]AHG01245.1 molybdenum cofactor cytidylyltransferase [Halostagnicola larsenii XH-48]
MTGLVGVVLAAGLGTRFEDGNKLLARVEGEPIVGRAARSIADASLDRTIATLGHDGPAVRRAVDPHVDETIQVDEYERGQSRSVRAGARYARETTADAALFLPGDMPCVESKTVRRLVDAYRSAGDGAVVPTYDDRRGNPVLFDAAHFDELASLAGDTGGRELFEKIDVRRVPTNDPGIHVDIDTRTDLWSVRQSGCDTGRS